MPDGRKRPRVSMVDILLTCDAVYGSYLAQFAVVAACRDT